MAFQRNFVLTTSQLHIFREMKANVLKSMDYLTEGGFQRNIHDTIRLR